MSRPMAVEEVKEPTPEERAKQLPDPVGFRLLCMLPEIEAKFEGTDLIRPDAVIDRERLTTVVLFVVKMGPDCYLDKQKFPSGPLCKVGDFILARQYSGTRFRIHGKELRILYDDQVEAVIADPRGVSMA